MSRLQLQRADAIVLVACTLLHAFLAATTNLSVDEAHYALYGALLDWSYFDHPPLVGWLQWPFVQLGGADGLMRVWAMGAWLLSAWLIMRLTQTLFADQPLHRLLGVRLDLLLYALALLPHLLGLAWVPDSALTVIACALTLHTWTLIQDPQPPTRQFWLMGLWLGLAGLTKYTAVLLAAGVCLALLTHRRVLTDNLWRWLGSGMVALICILPVLYWNQQHQWISFDYQLHHASGDTDWQWLYALRYLLVIWLAFGLLMPIAVFQGIRHQWRHPGVLLLLAMTLPSLAMWLWASGHGNALPHWSVPALTLLLPLAAQGVAQLQAQQRRWWRSVLLAQGAIVVAFLSLMAMGDWRARATSIAGQTGSNPFADLYGWQEAAHTAQTLAQSHQVDRLAVMNWTLASRLAWYARPMPVVVLDQRIDQFDLWFGELAPQQSAIVVNWSQMPYDLPTNADQFKSCDWLSRTPVVHGGRTLSEFNFYLCHDWRSPTGVTP